MNGNVTASRDIPPCPPWMAIESVLLNWPLRVPAKSLRVAVTLKSFTYRVVASRSEIAANAIFSYDLLYQFGSLRMEEETGDR